MGHLYSLCWLNDGCHWLLMHPDGEIVTVSDYGFRSSDEALIDLKYRV